MNLTWIDWAIVIVATLITMVFVLVSRRYMKSVADFLSAGRSAGRYLLIISGGMAGLCAITIIANWEAGYVTGFSLNYWGFTHALFGIIMTVTGWIIYRFRETRALTLSQFFEMRYSRRFRIFAGILSFVSGIINFGIFPAAAANFFIYYAGLPATFSVLGLEISTYAFAMIILISIALFFVFVGGQVAILISGFLQGCIFTLGSFILAFYLLGMFDFTHLFEGLMNTPVETSKIHPFKISAAKDFNMWYFLIGVVGMFYNRMSWQGTQAYNSSAKSAHEARMSGVVAAYNGLAPGGFLTIAPIVAYVIFQHPDFSAQAAQINASLSQISGEAIQNQARVPLTMFALLPVGMRGILAALIVMAFVSTHDSYLHSWGSIFIQDVVLPLYKKHLTPRQHINLLKLAILGIAIFIFLFSLWYHQTQYILMFFAVSAAIFVGGSGAVIIGGLYWKRGNTAAAWAALIVGSVLASSGIILDQPSVWQAIPGMARYFGPKFPINGQIMWLIAMVGAAGIYVLVSLLTSRQNFNLDRLLHRGQYAQERQLIDEDLKSVTGWRVFAFSKEFTRKDKWLTIGAYAISIFWVLIFFIGVILQLTVGTSDRGWMKFWYYWLWIGTINSVFINLWFYTGGFKDLFNLFKALKTLKRDEFDDGSVRSVNE
jgi:SSS family solute:Na+ symporter